MSTTRADYIRARFRNQMQQEDAMRILPIRRMAWSGDLVEQDDVRALAFTDYAAGLFSLLQTAHFGDPLRRSSPRPTPYPGTPSVAPARHDREGDAGGSTSTTPAAAESRLLNKLDAVARARDAKRKGAGHFTDADIARLQAEADAVEAELVRETERSFESSRRAMLDRFERSEQRISNVLALHGVYDEPDDQLDLPPADAVAPEAPDRRRASPRPKR